jgi:hypothetical protein
MNRTTRTLQQINAIGRTSPHYRAMHVDIQPRAIPRSIAGTCQDSQPASSRRQMGLWAVAHRPAATRISGLASAPITVCADILQTRRRQDHASATIVGIGAIWPRDRRSWGQSTCRPEGTSRAYCFNTFRSDSWRARARARGPSQATPLSDDNSQAFDITRERQGVGKNPSSFLICIYPSPFAVRSPKSGAARVRKIRGGR